MDELEDIVQRMIDAGESEEDIKLVIENYENTSAETDTQDFPTAVATETAPVTADATAEDTDLALVDTSLESPEAAVEVEDPLSSWQSIKNSFSNLGEQVNDVFEFWLDTEGEGGGARASLDIASNAVWSMMFGQESVDEYVKEKGKDSYMAKGVGSESTLKSIKKFEEEKLESKETKGVIESIKNGDIGGAFAGTINALTSAVGSVAFGVGTVGAGFFSEYVAENYVEFNKLKAKNLGISVDELIKSGEADTAIPVGMGIVSSSLEYVGIGAILKGVKGASKGTAGSGNLISQANKYLAAKTIYSKNARAVMNTLATGTTEFTTEILQHAADEVNKEFGSVAGTDKEAKVGKAFIDAITSQEGLEAGVQGFLGGGGLAAGSYSAKAMNTIRTITDARSIDKSLNALSSVRAKYNKSTDDVVKEGLQKEIDNKESEIADAVRNGNIIYENLTDGQISEIETLTDLADASAYKITELNKKLRSGEISEETYNSAKSGFDTEYKSARQKLLDMQLDKNLEFAKEEGLKRGLEFEVYENQKDFNEAVLAVKNVSEESVKEFKDIKGRTHGTSIGNKILINKEFAREEGAINVGSHELLHPIFNKLIGDSKNQGKFVRQFKRSMTSSQRRFIDGEMKRRDYTGKRYNTEYMNVFSDALREKQINYDKTTFEKIGDAIVGLFKPRGYENISFDSGQDVYNFIKEYDQSADKGALTSKAEKALGDVDLSDAVLTSKQGDEVISKSNPFNELQDQLNELDVMDFDNEIEYDQAVANLENKIRLTKRKETLAKRDIKKEVKEKVVADKKIFDNEGLVETIKSKETTRKEKSNAETELLESFDTLALKAIKYDTRKGDYDRTEIRDYLRQFLPGIIDKYKPSVNITQKMLDGKAETVLEKQDLKIFNSYKKNNPSKELKLNDNIEVKFSTWAYNNIAPKAQQTYERFRKIADKSLDVTAGELGSVKETAVEQSTDGGLSNNIETKTKPKGGTIKPVNLLKDPEVIQQYKEAVAKAFKDLGLNLDNLTFGKITDLAPEVIAKYLKLPLNKITNPADNLAFKDFVVTEKMLTSDKKKFVLFRENYPEAKVGDLIKSEARKIQEFVKTNLSDIIRLMPAENVAPELAGVDAQAYLNVKGTGLKIKPSLLKYFYEKTGNRSKGISSQVGITKLKKLTKEEFLEGFGITKDPDGKFRYVNEYDLKIGQRLKSIVDLFGKLATNTEVRQLEGVTDAQAQNIAAGKSDIQFSNALRKSLNLKKSDVKFDSIQQIKSGRKALEKLIKELGPNDTMKFILPTAQSGWGLIGGKFIVDDSNIDGFMKIIEEVEGKKRTRQFLTVGRGDFFKNIADKVFKTVDYVKGKDYAIINGVKIETTKIPSQSTKGFNDGNFEKNINKRREFAIEQRAGLKNIVEKLTILYKDEQISKNDLAMILATFNSSINALVRPAAIPGLYFKSSNYELDSEYRYEHTKTAADVLSEISKLISDENYKQTFEDILGDYRIAIIPVVYDKVLDKFYKQKGPRDKKGFLIKGKGVNVARYTGKEIKEAFKNAGLPSLKLKEMQFSISSSEQNKKDFYSVWATEAEMQAELYEAVEKARKPNNKTLPEGFRLSGDFTNQEVLDKMKELDDQQAEAGIQFSNSQNLDKDFNDILEKKSGIASDKEYKRVKAEVLGASKGRFNFFIPPSAEDFVGLLYATLGKNKTGDAQMAWYKKNLLNPFAIAMENVSRDRNSLGRDFRALKKTLKIVPKNLKKKLPGEPFTTEQAVRVWIWNQIGKDVPGLDDADVKTLVDYVNSRPDLQSFGTEIMKLNKGTAYTSPTDSWNTGTITTDLLETLNTTKRKEYLELWQQNVDIIFSEKNLNKLEAIYGKQYRKAMENILSRMKTGKNRVTGSDSLTTRVTDWLTGSIGAIMFFNTRSAVLQTLSAVNFINFGDNNILAAGKAFANQKQYWTDFKKLFNSEFLIERRDGLKMNVNEADIADIAKEKGVRGVINKLLKLGFTPTQLADSFAIASGGSTFYRNRLNALIKGGMNTQAAEKQAMSDFREIAEESQQSSRPDKISQQQAGPLGRIVLAFANTPAQYARLIKKAASDLKNGRGNAKTNISKIIYYGVAQNLIFNALQQALFAISFGEDEEEDEKKVVGIANGMADSLLRGIGIGGAIISTVKNAGLKLAKENAKKNPKYEEVAIELLKISPPVASKIGKVRAAGRSYSWDKKEMKEKGWSLDNPAYLANANIISAASNIPLDRVVKKIDNITASTGANLSFMQRVALLAGWSEWQLGIDKDDKKNKPKKGRTINKRVINKRVVNKRTIN